MIWNTASLTAVQLMGLGDIVAAMIILWAMIHNTTEAGFGTTRARFALFRRAVYCLVSISLFGLGWDRVNSFPLERNADLIFHAILVFAITIFPLLRLLGMISQDSFIALSIMRRNGGLTHHHD